MIDTHCHILPGLDDGPGRMEDALAMAKTLVEHGFQAVLATPHVIDREGYLNTREGIMAGLQALREALAEAQVPLQLYPGAEYHLHRGLSEIARLNHPLATLADSLYVLVELPVMQLPSYLEYSSLPAPADPPELKKVLPFLRPIIAHPERNEEALHDYRRLHKLRAHGYLFQVNLESIMGWAGKDTVKVVKRMASERLIDLVGTDGHTPEGLAKLLPGWRKQVEKLLGRLAERVLVENPRRVLNNEEIEWED